MSLFPASSTLNGLDPPSLRHTRARGELSAIEGCRGFGGLIGQERCGVLVMIRNGGVRSPRLGGSGPYHCKGLVRSARSTNKFTCFSTSE